MIKYIQRLDIQWIPLAIALIFSVCFSFWLRSQEVEGVSSDCECPSAPDTIASDCYNRCLEGHGSTQNLTDNPLGSNNWLDTGD